MVVSLPVATNEMLRAVHTLPRHPPCGARFQKRSRIDCDAFGTRCRLIYLVFICKYSAAVSPLRALVSKNDRALIAMLLERDAD